MKNLAFSYWLNQRCVEAKFYTLTYSTEHNFTEGYAKPHDVNLNVQMVAIYFQTPLPISSPVRFPEYSNSRTFSNTISFLWANSVIFSPAL